MIERSTRALSRRALIVDDEVRQAATAGGRSVRALAEELRARGIEVVEEPEPCVNAFRLPAFARR